MLLVVESVSPSSVTLDRVAKPAVYAEQGIPYFWRVDSLVGEGPRLQVYRLDAATGAYVLDMELGPGEHGGLTAPWPVTLDMIEFVMPHKR